MCEAEPCSQTHLDVLVGLELADVLLQEEQIQRQVVPLPCRGGHDAHRGQRLVGLQEVGVSMADQGAETGVDHHGNQSDEQHQVDEAGRQRGLKDDGLLVSGFT